MRRVRQRLCLVASLLGAMGTACSFVVSLDGLSEPPVVLPVDAFVDTVIFQDAIITDAAQVHDARDSSLPSDGGRETGIVACEKTPTCPVPTEGCCIVYAGVQDFCVKRDRPSDCAFGSALTVLALCDDDDDCAVAGEQEKICCGQVAPGDGGPFKSLRCLPPNECTGDVVTTCDSVKRACAGGKTCLSGIHSAPIRECR